MHDWFNVGYQAFLNGEYSEPVGLTERQLSDWLEGQDTARADQETASEEP